MIGEDFHGRADSPKAAEYGLGPTAFNGFAKAIDLPGGFALFVLPYTRSISPSGIEYEGVGVQADFIVKNSVADFRMHRDAVLRAHP